MRTGAPLRDDGYDGYDRYGYRIALDFGIGSIIRYKDEGRAVFFAPEHLGNYEEMVNMMLLRAFLHAEEERG